MEWIDGFAVYSEKSHIFFAFYLALLIDKTYSLASIHILFYLSQDILGYLGVFPHQDIWVEPMQIKTILMHEHQALLLILEETSIRLFDALYIARVKLKREDVDLGCWSEVRKDHVGDEPCVSELKLA